MIYFKSKLMTKLCLFVFIMIHEAFVTDGNPSETDIISDNDDVNMTVADDNPAGGTAESKCLSELTKAGYNLQSGVEIYLKRFETISAMVLVDNDEIPYSQYDDTMERFESECRSEITMKADVDYVSLLNCDLAIIIRPHCAQGTVDIECAEGWCEIQPDGSESMPLPKTAQEPFAKRRKVQMEGPPGVTYYGHEEVEPSVTIRINPYGADYKMDVDNEDEINMTDCLDELVEKGFIFDFGLDNYAYRVITDKSRNSKMSFEKNSFSSNYIDFLTEKVQSHEKKNGFENAELWCKISECDRILREAGYKDRYSGIGHNLEVAKRSNTLEAGLPMSYRSHLKKNKNDGEGHLGTHEWCKKNVMKIP